MRDVRTGTAFGDAQLAEARAADAARVILSLSGLAEDALVDYLAALNQAHAAWTADHFLFVDELLARVVKRAVARVSAGGGKILIGTKGGAR